MPEPTVRARSRTALERRLGAAPFGPLVGARVGWNGAAAAAGIGAAIVLFAVIARLTAAPPSPGRPARGTEAARSSPAPSKTPAESWQPVADHLLAHALDGDTLMVVARDAESDARAADSAARIASAVAGGAFGPRLGETGAIPDTAAAAANWLAGPLAAGRLWVVWPLAAGPSRPEVAGSDAAGDDMGVPAADPVRAWLDANGRPVSRARLGDARGTGGWVLGAWEHAPTLDGGDYPPNVVAEPLGALTLVGWDIAPRPLRAGRAARLRAAWLVGRDGAPDYRITFRLLDAKGAAVAVFDDAPALRLAPVSTWPDADITVITHDLSVGAAVPAGAYDLAANAVDPATGRGVAPGAGRVIGAVRVERP